MKFLQKGCVSFIALLLVLMSSAPVFANTTQAKIYKSVFGVKPKCITCHVDKLPKKADGKHEPNEYGKKLRAAKAVLDEEAYKTVGPNDKAEITQES